MKFGYLTWTGDPNNVVCDCGRTIRYHLSNLKRKRKVCCGHEDCHYSKPFGKHPRYREYKKYQREHTHPFRFWHWLELNP